MKDSSQTIGVKTNIHAEFMRTLEESIRLAMALDAKSLVTQLVNTSCFFNEISKIQIPSH